MTEYEYNRTKAQLSVLKDLQGEYGHKTLDNVVHSLTQIVKHYETKTLNIMEGKELQLMIGDFVGIKCVDGSTFNIKVTSINKLLVEGIRVPDYKFSSWGYYTDLSPIPLTKETLEKSGFVLQKNNEGWKKEYVFAHGELWVSVSFYDDGKILVRMETRSKECTGVNQVHNCDIRFVHQLQQAMRLCGIEKELKIE